LWIGLRLLTLLGRAFSVTLGVADGHELCCSTPTAALPLLLPPPPPPPLLLLLLLLL
jgi:hypothetical protein